MLTKESIEKFTLDGGVRVVERYYGERDAWATYYVIPRSLAAQWLRQDVAAGIRPSSVDDIVGGRINLREYYGGPGRLFHHKARRVKSSRRWIVYRQSSGYDI